MEEGSWEQEALLPSAPYDSLLISLWNKICYQASRLITKHLR